MSVKWIRVILLSVLLLPFVFLHPASAAPVDGYDGLVARIADGKDNKQSIMETIQASQKAMLKEYFLKQSIPSVQKRFFNFQQPVGLHLLNDQYLAISFEADIFSQNRKTNAIWVLVFNRASPGTITYADKYIAFETDEQVTAYRKSPDAAICAYCQQDFDITCDATVTVKTKTGEKRILVKNLVTKEDFEAEFAKKAGIHHTHSASDITSGKLNEQFIDDSICRDSELKAAVAAMKKNAVAVAAAAPSIDLNPVVIGFEKKSKEIEALQAEVAELKKTVTQLSQLLAGVTRNKNDIIFSKVNIHIVNGTGTTEGAPNGLGNLIVGYNESSKAHSGSHNVVIGKNLTYTSYGGLVVGESNAISAPYAVVSGGYNNKASGKYASVTGGQLNNASGDYATVSGGLTRKADKNNNWAGGDNYSLK